MKNYIYRKKTESIALLISLFSVFFYRMFLSDTGMGYAAPAYLVCAFLWMLLGEGLSEIVSKMIRARLAKGQKTNALNIVSVMMMNQFLGGVIGSVLCGFMTFYLMQGPFGLPKGRFLGFYLSVFFFFRMINEYLTGYALSSSGEKAVCIASVSRQLFRIVLGFILMSKMAAKGETAGHLLMDADMKYIYSAYGLFIGFCIAEFLVFAFLFIVRLGLKLKSNGNYESFANKDHAPEIFLNIWKKRLGEIVHGLSFSLFLIAWICTVSDPVSIGIAFSAIFIPFAIASGFAVLFGTASTANWAQSVRKNEKGNARAYYDFGTHIAIIAAVFVTSFFASVSKPFLRTVVPEHVSEVTTALILTAVASVFYAVALFTDRICAMRDDRISRMIADAVAALFAFLSVRITAGSDKGVYFTLTVSVIVYCLASMIIWCVIAYFRLSMFFDPLRNILIPVVSGAVTAIILLIMTNAAAPHLGNLFTILICIPIGLIIYHSVLLLLRNYTEQELKLMPLGGALYSLGQILKVM